MLIFSEMILVILRSISISLLLLCESLKEEDFLKVLLDFCFFLPIGSCLTSKIWQMKRKETNIDLLIWYQFREAVGGEWGVGE